MFRSFILKASLLVTMVSLCVGVPIANADGVTWTSPTTKSLNSVYMISADDGWAVGVGGTIIRWNGTEWTNATSPTTENLNDVFMFSTDYGWAVGADGTIVHWTGIEWIPEFPMTILTPLTIGLTLVAVILVRLRQKRCRKTVLPSKTQLQRPK